MKKLTKILGAASIIAMLAGSAGAATINFTTGDIVFSSSATVILPAYDNFIPISYSHTMQYSVSGKLENKANIAATVIGDIAFESISAFFVDVYLVTQVTILLKPKEILDFSYTNSYTLLGTFNTPALFPMNIVFNVNTMLTLDKAFVKNYTSPGATASVEVTYSAVPIPAALPLLAGAFGLLGLASLNRKSKVS
jgi:hypothetical protein